MIDPQELAKKAKSKFGPAKRLVRPRWKTILEKYFFKSTNQRAYLQGGITVGLIVYWWFTHNPLLLIIWFFVAFANSLVALVYWKKESINLSKEIENYDQEIKDIQKEIAERQEYFEDIKKQLNKTSKN
jgi:hypothetical protein